MNITSLFGTITGNDEGLSIISKIINSTLKELDVQINDINLGYSDIPYFDGVISQSIIPITQAIENSDGVIILTTTPYGMPCSVFQTFLEHLQIEQYKNIFDNKLCMIIIISQNSDIGLNNVSYIIRSLGAHDSIRLDLDNNFIKQLSKNLLAKEYIESQTEDFYRIVNQKRKFYIPKKNNNIFINNDKSINNNKIYSNPENKINTKNKEANEFLEAINRNNENKNLQLPDTTVNNNLSNLKTTGSSEFNNIPKPKQNFDFNEPNIKTLKQNFDFNENVKNKSPINTQTNPIKNDESIKAREVYNNIAIDNFNKKQQDDIDKITKLFSEKYQENQPNINKNKEEKNLLQPLVPNIPKETSPKNCRQLTSCLTHFYQPQVESGLNAAIQLDITGTEAFKGYITIENINCTYEDGTIENPSATIISQDSIWKNIVTGKITAQKAFMMGQIKVRGNFVLLTKFDKIFNFSKNTV